MTDTRPHQSLLSQHTGELLAHTIRQVLDGTASASEVTAVLRRACVECRDLPPELLVLRIKELWAKVAEGSRVVFQERDRRYFAVIGECLVLYYELPMSGVRHSSSREVPRAWEHGGCGEPEIHVPR